MATLIELYDSEPMKNIYAADALSPDRIIFLGGDEMVKGKRRLCRYFAGKAAPKLHFEVCSIHDSRSCEEALRRLIRSYPDARIDLTGGTDEAVFAAGRLSAETDVPFIKSDIKKGVIRSVCNTAGLIAHGKTYSLDDRIRAAGAEIRGSGRYNLKDISKKIGSSSDVMWRIFLDYRAEWSRQVRYFQRVMGYDDNTFNVLKNTGDLVCNMGIMRRLKNDGILAELQTNGNKIYFRFANPYVRKIITDVGVWLELFVYKAALGSGVFSDTDISVLIDWDGIDDDFNVINEIDVIAQKKEKTVFISCKSGPVSVEAVNEINVLKNRFGGEFSRAVIVTATPFSAENLCVYRRALELGIIVAELDDLKNDGLCEVFKNI